MTSKTTEFGDFKMARTELTDEWDKCGVKKGVEHTMIILSFF